MALPNKNSIDRSKNALNAIYLIHKYFNKKLLLSIITSNYYSVLYNNAEVWLLPPLSPQLKQKILSASAAPLKLTTNNYNYMMSFDSMHYVNQRATHTPNTQPRFMHFYYIKFTTTKQLAKID